MLQSTWILKGRWATAHDAAGWTEIDHVLWTWDPAPGQQVSDLFAHLQRGEGHAASAAPRHLLFQEGRSVLEASGVEPSPPGGGGPGGGPAKHRPSHPT